MTPEESTAAAFGDPPLAGTNRAARAPRGLSTSEATARLRQVGPNVVAAPARFTALRALAGYASNPLVLVLAAASTLSAILGELSSALVVT